MTRDREIYRNVRRDALAGAGGMVSVQAVFLLLDSLEQRFGERFTVDGACQALDQLIKMATLTKDELRKGERQEFAPTLPVPLDDADREWGRESARKLGYTESKEQ
jgi:hypothetical protein